MKYLRLLPILFILVFAFVNADAQKVRLRSNIVPQCGSSSELKFADIYAEGNIAVMGSYNCRGAFIFDISNPDRPVLASWYNPSPNQQFLEAIIVNGKGYFGSGTTGGEGVHIVDLSDPYSPVFLGKVTPSIGNGHTYIHEMMIHEQSGATYLIANSNSLSNKIIKIINVSDPANPVFIRDMNPTEVQWVHAMHIRGNRMFTSGWGNSGNRAKTEIWDISNLATTAPTLLGVISDTGGSIAFANSMHSSWTSEDGNYLYSARETTSSNSVNAGDIRVYNITDPAAPLLVNRITMTDLGLNAVTPHNPVVKGNKLYVSWYQAGLQVFDITDPTTPKRIGQYDTYMPAFAPDESAKELRASASSSPWDIMCGSDSFGNALPTTYAGAWAVFPFIGDDRILVGDLATGLYILDATGLDRPAKNIVSDFDGDVRTDISLYSPSTGLWHIRNSSTGGQRTVHFGLPEDIKVTGDYDGDGKADIAVWRPSTGIWHINGSTVGYTGAQFGMNGDVPVPGDYDADGRTDLAIWRPSTGVWYINQSSLGVRIFHWGMQGDMPIVGDYDGDGKADIAVWRPGSGVWYILQSSSSLPMYMAFGMQGDKPLVADMNGDGRADFTIYRPSTGVWYMLSNGDFAFSAFHFGVSEDIPVAADYDGDGKADIAVFRPSGGIWYRVNSSDGSIAIDLLGGPDDVPSPTTVMP
ncbi:MAG: VCBS repeat-containing protein [Acidobacteria bacterium]|nr:VCBS repeat-containing protein [Acidobacteriota bacterium]